MFWLLLAKCFPQTMENYPWFKKNWCTTSTPQYVHLIIRYTAYDSLLPFPDIYSTCLLQGRIGDPHYILLVWTSAAEVSSAWYIYLIYNSILEICCQDDRISSKSSTAMLQQSCGVLCHAYKIFPTSPPCNWGTVQSVTFSRQDKDTPTHSISLFFAHKGTPWPYTDRLHQTLRRTLMSIANFISDTSTIYSIYW